MPRALHDGPHKQVQEDSTCTRAAKCVTSVHSTTCYIICNYLLLFGHLASMVKCHQV